MTTPTRSVSLVLRRLRRALRALQDAVGAWVPRPAPVLVPIPVRVDRWRDERLPPHRHPGC